MEEARDALRSYDYVLEGDTWYHRLKRVTTQSWQEVDEGFLRFDPENGSWYPVPYMVHPDFAKSGGLDFRKAEHAQCFTWVHPPGYVERMYREAWEAKKARAEERAKEKGAAALEVARITTPAMLTETREAVEAAVARETEPQKKPWWKF